MKAKLSQLLFILQACIASFGVYFCMYAYRKTFSVATFEGLSLFHIDYKIVLIIAQVLGYIISKFFGIRFISELQKAHRAKLLVGLILVDEILLFLFGATPAPYNIIFMFLAGLPLGLIWGIVFSYLEGRKVTEILGVALCASFIVSSGIVKSVGLYLMQHWHVSEFWMPSATGALFILPLIFFTYLLEKIPAPTVEDQELRTERLPMSRSDRTAVLKKFLFPISILVLFYMMLTAFRDFRDNFSREIWDSIGYKGDIAVYTTSESLVAIIVLIMLGSVFFIKDNLKALLAYHYLLLLGISVIAISTALFQMGYFPPFYWMVASGFGLYICYVPFNCLFFERFVAAFQIKGNTGFLIYIADSFGYLGSVSALLYKNFGQSDVSWLHFFINGAYVIAGLGLLIVLNSYIYFKKKHQKQYNAIESIQYEHSV